MNRLHRDIAKLTPRETAMEYERLKERAASLGFTQHQWVDIVTAMLDTIEQQRKDLERAI